MNGTLRALLAHKAWATDGFFAALDTVDAAAHGAERHTAIRLLNHIHVVDRIFAAHLRGEPHGYAATNTPETPTAQDLREAVRATDRWYDAYVAALPAERLAEPIAFTFTDGQAGRMTREEMLVHVITHASYHRGEVGRILKQIDVAPPRDLVTAYLHQNEPQRRAPA